MLQFDDESGLRFACAMVAMHALIPSEFPLEVEDVTALAFKHADSMMAKLKATTPKKEG